MFFIIDNMVFYNLEFDSIELSLLKPICRDTNPKKQLFFPNNQQTNRQTKRTTYHILTFNRRIDRNRRIDGNRRMDEEGAKFSPKTAISKADFCRFIA